MTAIQAALEKADDAALGAGLNVHHPIRRQLWEASQALKAATVFDNEAEFEAAALDFCGTECTPLEVFGDPTWA